MKTPLWLVLIIGGAMGIVAAGIAWKYTQTAFPEKEHKEEKNGGRIAQLQPPVSSDTEKPPTFREKVEKATISFGEGGISYSVPLDGTPAEPFIFGGYKPIRVYFENGKFFADVSLYGGSSQSPVEVRHNEFVVRVPGWDRNFDSSALEIVNNDKSPIFQFIYQTPYYIIINGIFPSPAGLMLANDDCFVQSARSIRKSFRIIRLFKYPSGQFIGVREEPKHIIPGPNLKGRAIDLSIDLKNFAKECEKVFEDAIRNKNPMIIDFAEKITATYDERFGLRAASIAEEMSAAGINVGRLSSKCRTANSPRDMQEIAEELRIFSGQVP